MAADVAQCERSNIKCYASAFSNILINVRLHNPMMKQMDTHNMKRLSIAIHTVNTRARNITKSTTALQN